MPPALLRRAARALALVGFVALAGCAGARPTASSRALTLALDFNPSAVHAGIYSAVARGYDRSTGIRLSIREPSSSTDGLRLLLGGRAQLAILDIHDLALAREQGRDLVGVMALVQRPLAAVLAQPAIRSPRALEGRRVGVTGLASDRAVLRSVVLGAHGDAARVREIDIGFNAVASLISGRVAAATAFWNVEGVALRRRRAGTRTFRVDDYGAPPYPELVLCTTGALLRRDPDVVRRALRAVARGYRLALSDPQASLGDLEAREPGLDRSLLRAQLAAVRPALLPPGGRFGKLDRPALAAWAVWERRFGIISRPLDVARAFDDRLTRAM